MKAKLCFVCVVVFSQFIEANLEAQERIIKRDVTEEMLVMIDPTAEAGYRFYDTETFYAISPNGSRLVFVTSFYGSEKNRRMYLNEPGKLRLGPYDSISNITFSPDGRRIAFTALAGDETFVVADGLEQQHLNSDSGLTNYCGDKRLVFSQDGSHLAYLAKAGNAVVLMLDGKEAARYVAIVDNGSSFHGGIVFSPDGKRMAYTASDNRDYNGVFIVLDGKKSVGQYGSTLCPAFSPDGKRFAFVAQMKSGGCFVILDGREFKQHNLGHVSDARYTHMAFSADSLHFAFTAGVEMNKGKRFMVLDGKKTGKMYDQVYFPTFSPNGKRLAYLAIRGGDAFWVVDGREGKKFKTMYGPITAFNNFVFSSDSGHFGYEINTEDKQLVVVDGQEQGKDGFYSHNGRLTFSPDGKRFVFCTYSDIDPTNAARRGKWKAAIVIDGKKSEKEYSGVDYPVFGPDSKRIAYMAFAGEETGAKMSVVVDDVDGEEYDMIIGGRIFFSGPNDLHYFVRKGYSFYLIKEKLE